MCRMSTGRSSLRAGAPASLPISAELPSKATVDHSVSLEPRQHSVRSINVHLPVCSVFVVFIELNFSVCSDEWCRPLVAQECGPLIKSASNRTNLNTKKKMEANETSANQTMSGQEDQYNWPFIIVFAFVVAGTVGNILVCLAVSLERPLQNVTNWFLVSLAFADLLVSTVVMPFGATAGFLGKIMFHKLDNRIMAT